MHTFRTGRITDTLLNYLYVATCSPPPFLPSRSLSQEYRSRPAARSEAAALFGLDPSTLAALALKDAERAVALRPTWAKAYSRQGLALYLCERYEDAREAYLAGLLLEPGNAALAEGLAQVAAVLDEQPAVRVRAWRADRHASQAPCAVGKVHAERHVRGCIQAYNEHLDIASKHRVAHSEGCPNTPAQVPWATCPVTMHAWMHACVCVFVCVFMAVWCAGAG